MSKIRYAVLILIAAISVPTNSAQHRVPQSTTMSSTPCGRYVLFQGHVGRWGAVVGDSGEVGETDEHIIKMDTQTGRTWFYVVTKRGNDTYEGWLEIMEFPRGDLPK